MLKYVALALAILATPAPALAHRHGEDGAQHQEHTQISRERAIEIAREQGAASIREVEMDDGNWKVEGSTAAGRRIEIEINSHSGVVVKREIY